MNSVKLAKFLMKKFALYPVSPEVYVGELNEVFRHPVFLNGSESKRKEIMLKSSESKYNSELNYPWDQYFGVDLIPLLQGKHVLDLGCFTGGRSVAWCERYEFSYLIGIDINQVFIDAAKQFAKIKSARADFKLAKAEFLPFEDDAFDAVLSMDVFEHVQDLKQTLNECYRVLKTGGKLFVVFPSYFHPKEHHLSLITNVLLIQYIFSGKTLIKAYCEILEERGSEASWYKRDNPQMEAWERCNTINGTTLSLFRKLLRDNDWKIVLQSKKPIGSIGRNISKKRIFRLISNFLYPFTYLPLFQEIFLHRITFILEK